MKKINIEKEVLEEELSKNQTKLQCAKNLGIDICTFRKLCIEKKVKNYIKINFRRGKDLPLIRPDIDRQWFIDNWIKTAKSLKILAQEEGITEAVLDNRRRKYGLEKPYKYSVNIDKIFNLKDPNIYYLAGLLATDGYFPQKQDSFELDLSGEDEFQLLTLINSYLESTHPIKTYGKSHRLRIVAKGSRSFFETNLGIVSHDKSHTVGIPKVFYSEDCAKAYVRGCIDGDGYISKNGYMLVLVCGSYNLVDGLYSIIKKYCNIECNRSNIIVKDIEYPRISLYGKKAKKLFDWIYSDNSDFKLIRKYKRYCEGCDLKYE